MKGDPPVYYKRKSTYSPVAAVLAVLFCTVFAAGGVFAQRTYSESPMLTELVEAGQLPPVEERLPEEPFIVDRGTLLAEDAVDNWQPGVYGGTLNQKATHPNGFVNVGGGATLLRAPGQSTADFKPNVLSDLQISEDNTVFQLTLRKGLRWSDGVPVTTEDVRFTFKDLYENPEVGMPFPTQLHTQADPNLEPGRLDIVDAYTFTLTFEKPYGMFVADLASWISYYDFLLKPSHYLKQFHEDYADADTLAMSVRANSASDWTDLLRMKDVFHWDVGTERALGFPVLNAWVLTGHEGQRTIFTRNPYFHHVDTEGQQLPYIDYVVVEEVVDHQAIQNKVMAGEVEIATGGELSLKDIPVYAQNAERAGYKLFLTGSTSYPPTLFLNQDFEYDVEGSVWQQLVQDPEKRFGKALAAAINADDINETVFFGQFGEPFWNNTVYDPNLAVELLTDIGFGPKDRDGFLLGPDGKPFEFVITVGADHQDMVPVAELLKEYFDGIGLRTKLNAIAGGLYEQRKTANEMMASMQLSDGPIWAAGISEDFLPHEKGGWSPLTWRYYTSGGEAGRKPPAYLQQFYDLFTERKQYVPSSPEGEAAWARIEQWMIDNYVMIPTTGLMVKPNIVAAGLRNHPNENSLYELDTYISPEQWFWENPK